MPQEKAGGPAALLLTATAARRFYFDGVSKSEIAAELGRASSRRRSGAQTSSSRSRC